MNNPILRNALVTFASFIFVITIVGAWTAPGATPPNGNVSAPLTIGATSQSKVGGLDVGWLSSVGSIKVGNTATACSAGIAGSLRWTGTAMEHCNGTAWLPFGGGGISSITGGSCAVGQVVQSISATGAVTCGADSIASVKDGVNWSEVTEKPVDLSPSGTWCGAVYYYWSGAEMYGGSYTCKGMDIYPNTCPSGYTFRTIMTDTGGSNISTCMKN